ncbi:MAG: PrnB family protein [Francisellaceae bacterium]
MSQLANCFDEWIRRDFKQLNTELETLYFNQKDRTNIIGIGDELKQELLYQGNTHISALLKEGNTDEGFEAGFTLLGNVGFFMAACRRHELSNPDREHKSPLKEASSLSMQLGASLGLTPRFATSHLTTHNTAINGQYKSFTALQDEYCFLEFNTRSILADKRASDALVRILPLGISHPVAYDLLTVAKSALEEALNLNKQLFDRLDIERFFYCVRPYYKPHRVGLHVYRGANAGDFAGINVIDLLLGLCSGADAFYSQLLVDKFLYMMPEDQALLRDCLRRKSLMQQFLEKQDYADSDWFQKQVRLFLELCELHGQIAAQHHDQLVRRFIELPSQDLPKEQAKSITASGPPLSVLLKSLEQLRDLRGAKDRDDIDSRYKEIQRLRQSLSIQDSKIATSDSLL